MPIFFFIFWGFIVALIGGGWLVSGAVMLLARRRKWRKTKLISGVIFGGFTIVAALSVTVVGWGWVRSSTPRFVFEDTFHQKPPPGTVILHGESGGFADSASVTLAFRTDRATFDRLRAEQFERADLKDYRAMSREYPKWWRTPGEDTEIWIKDRSYSTIGFNRPAGQSFGSEWTLMTRDADGLVQYLWVGID